MLIIITGTLETVAIKSQVPQSREHTVCPRKYWETWDWGSGNCNLFSLATFQDGESGFINAHAGLFENGGSPVR